MSAPSASRRAVQLSPTNVEPAVRLSVDSDNNAFSTFHSRDAIVRIPLNNFVSLELTNGRVHGGGTTNTPDLTSMGIFDIDELIRNPGYFFVGRETSLTGNGNVAFPDVHTDDPEWRGTAYQCNRDTLMYVFLSVGARSGTNVEVEITHEFQTGGRVGYKLMQLDTQHNGHEMVSRSILVDCKNGDTIYVYSQQGEQIFSDSSIRTAFGGFHYDPIHGQIVAWAAYRTTNMLRTNTNGYSLISFNQNEADIPVNQPATGFVDSEFRATIDGVYMVHFSAGLTPASILDVGLFIGGTEKIASLYHATTDHNQKSVIARTVMVRLNAGQRLSIRASGATTLTSSPESKEIAFLGMLLYTF